jgi:hypothetical protein
MNERERSTNCAINHWQPCFFVYFKEFKYKTAEELQSLPFSATLDSYSGGGYVYRIRGSAKNIQNDLEDLRRLYWVDNNTRAVFLEFSTYNANVRLIQCFGIKKGLFLVNRIRCI